MKKRLSLTLIAAVIMGGCAHNEVDAYTKILQTKPKWEEDKSNQDKPLFIDVSSDLDIEKSPFLRIKTTGDMDGNVESIDIYRLDCKNQRVANYYSKISEKRKIEKTKEEFGYSEFSTDFQSEDYFFNPTEPKSLDRLWRSFPVGDNIFSNRCNAKTTDVKPQNTAMPDWTYFEDLSNINFATTYVNTAQYNQLKSQGFGELSIKSFDSSSSGNNSSRENKIKVDCKAKSATLLELIVRDNDFEYAPAADQSIFKYKKVLSPDQAAQAQTDTNEEWISSLCK